MIRKVLIISAIALLHFGIIVVLTYLGLYVVDGSLKESGAMNLASETLVWASRILYFPVITLSLFPRNMFPGALVYVPILLNSFIWGILLYTAAAVFNRIRG